MRRGGRDSGFGIGIGDLGLGIGIGDLGLWGWEGEGSRLWVEWRLKLRG